MSNIICGIDEPLPELPDLGLEVPCCSASSYRDFSACTCWRPVYEPGEQADPVGDLTPQVRPAGMCGDCAYRPGSPEKLGDPEHRGDATELEMLAESGRPFHCHDSMRRIVRWVHPSGAEIPGHDAAYVPPIIEGVPIKTDGTAAFLCAGWHARRRAIVAAVAKEAAAEGMTLDA